MLHVHVVIVIIACTQYIYVHDFISFINFQVNITVGSSGEVLLKNLSTHLAPTDQVAINLLFEVSDIHVYVHVQLCFECVYIIKVMFSLIRVVLVVRLQRQ